MDSVEVSLKRMKDWLAAHPDRPKTTVTDHEKEKWNFAPGVPGELQWNSEGGSTTPQGTQRTPPTEAPRSS